MPYVRMVALSGSVAHLNLEGAGDLDLFIVTRGRRVWSVTVATIVLAKLLGRRRTVCANFVVADTRLALEQQDLFTASQVIHLKPVVGVGRVPPAARGQSVRPAALSELPSADRPATSLAEGRRCTSRDPAGRNRRCPCRRWPSKPFCRRAYRAYLLRRSATWRSPDQVRLEARLLKLHTHSHRGRVLARFDRLAEAPTSGSCEHGHWIENL